MKNNIMKNSKFFATLLCGLLLALLPGCWSEHTCTDCAGHGEQQSFSLDKAESKKGLIVINVLEKEFYDDCHIKGSISVPFGQEDSFIAALEKKYGNNKDEIEVVVYCSNYMCSASGSITKKMISKGFKALAYEAGMADWYAQGLPSDGQCAKVTKAMPAPQEHTHEFPVISTQELAVKMGVQQNEQAANQHVISEEVTLEQTK